MFYEHKNSKLNLFSYISKEANFRVLHEPSQRMQCGIQQEGAALLRVENSCSGQLSILSLISYLIWSHTKNLHFDVPNKPSKLLCGNLFSSSQRNVPSTCSTCSISFRQWHPASQPRGQQSKPDCGLWLFTLSVDKSIYHWSTYVLFSKA